MFIYGRKLTPDESQQFMGDFYKLAYAMALKYAPNMPDDIREDAALKGLQTALRLFDQEPLEQPRLNPETKQMEQPSFQKYLWVCVTSAVKDALAKIKTRPLSVRDVPSDEGEEATSIFDFIADAKEMHQTDPEFYNALVHELDSRLSEIQKRILAMMMNPEEYAAQYNKLPPEVLNKYTKGRQIKNLNYEAIAALNQVSIATITYEVNKIRQITQQILKDLRVEGKKK
jgi:hypothetical protein